MKYDITDSKLAPKGKSRIEWAGTQMPVLELITQHFAKEKPLRGLRVSACLHVTCETANLMIALKAGGADSVLVASNPLSTQDDVAASLVVNDDITVCAINGGDRDAYYNHLNLALNFHPHITMDDGADLVTLLHTERKDEAENIWGSTEETTTGVIRLKALEKSVGLESTSSIMDFRVIAQ